MKQASLSAIARDVCATPALATKAQGQLVHTHLCAGCLRESPLFCCSVCSFEAAEADCNRALSAAGLAPADRVKALLRRGTARMHKGDLRGARADFREVLAAEPNNRQAREELKVSCRQATTLTAGTVGAVKSTAKCAEF